MATCFTLSWLCSYRNTQTTTTLMNAAFELVNINSNIVCSVSLLTHRPDGCLQCASMAILYVGGQGLIWEVGLPEAEDLTFDPRRAPPVSPRWPKGPDWSSIQILRERQNIIKSTSGQHLQKQTCCNLTKQSQVKVPLRAFSAAFNCILHIIPTWHGWKAGKWTFFVKMFYFQGQE